MNCLSELKEGAELLLEYCAGSLASTQKVELDRHIEHCAECRRVVESQREVWQVLDQWAAPEVTPGFDAKLYAKIASEEAAPAWKQWLRRVFHPAVPVPVWKPAVSLAAACAVLAVGLAVHPQPAADSSKQVHAEHVDIEQVANTLDDLELLTPSPSPM